MNYVFDEMESKKRFNDLLREADRHRMIRKAARRRGNRKVR